MPLKMLDGQKYSQQVSIDHMVKGQKKEEAFVDNYVTVVYAGIPRYRPLMLGKKRQPQLRRFSSNKI